MSVSVRSSDARVEVCWFEASIIVRALRRSFPTKRQSPRKCTECNDDHNRRVMGTPSIAGIVFSIFERLLVLFPPRLFDIPISLPQAINASCSYLLYDDLKIFIKKDVLTGVWEEQTQ